MSEQPTQRTYRKSAVARERILASALQLFAAQGYEATTMREIATQAGYSLGLAYRYFAGKEELVLLLYQQLALDLADYVETLPPEPLQERFRAAISKQLDLMTPYRETLGALFGAALKPAFLGRRLWGKGHADSSPIQSHLCNPGHRSEGISLRAIPPRPGGSRDGVGGILSLETPSSW